ncbi:MAG: 3-deoxy-D-manno-octulosonic acid kinase [Dokdonella sp.]|uniref:3-deoxy-D-manno-octulosonic acid kinase n=1 Tax=Dokdonella sp. TaxID=2291710 RepID=UPI0032647B70
MIEAQVQSTDTGAIVFDRAAGAVPDAAWFERVHGSPSMNETNPAAGRGGVAFVRTPAGECALRHYHRGGLVAHLSVDRYLWSGASRTRAFREFRLLAQLANAHLPVSEPVAARYVREGCRYRADLLTRRIAPARSLGERLDDGSLDAVLAQRVGRTLARFHAAGVWHADLNAHNILAKDGAASADESVFLIDFDRGRLRKPKLAWQQSNLKRLRRSLDKLGARKIPDFDARFWHPLLAAYDAAMARAGSVPSLIGTLS